VANDEPTGYARKNRPADVAEQKRLNDAREVGTP
jgi:hypothetical protein